MNKHVYTTTWRRAQVAYYGNGFIGRYLDAQDHEFLRGVAKAGTANGSIPGRDSVLLEELDYWHRPYPVDRTVIRRTGKGIRKFEQERAAAIIPDPNEARYQEKRRQDRKALSEEKRAAAQAYRKARRDLIAEREKRLRQTIESDALWYAEHPAYTDDWRPVSPRHYVPFWRRAQIESKETKKKQAEELAAQEEYKKRVQAERLKRIEEEQQLWAERKHRSDAAKLRHEARRKREANRAGRIQAAIINAERRERDAITATETTIIQAERARRQKFKQFLNEKEELDHIFDHQREPDEESIF